jgi:hypothetical protein
MIVVLHHAETILHLLGLKKGVLFFSYIEILAFRSIHFVPNYESLLV